MSARLVLVAAATSALAVAVGPSAGSAPVRASSLPKDTDGLVRAFAFGGRGYGSLYAATLSGRLYKTEDGGRHWIMSAALGDRVDSLATDPQRPTTLYAGTGVAVYRTANDGRTWKRSNRGLLPPPPVIAPMQVTGTRGWRRGEGWVTALAVDPNDGDVVYAGTGGGIKKSSDGGRSWKTVLWRGRFMFVDALAITPTRTPVIYAAASIAGPASCGAGGRIPCNRRIAGVFESKSGGRTWRAIGPDLLAVNPSGYPTFLAIDPEHPGTVYVAAARAVFESVNAGATWKSIAMGLPAKGAVSALAVDPASSGTVYVGHGNEGVFKSDRGLAWARAGSPFAVSALAVDPAHPVTIYAGVDQSDHRIAKSIDGGRTWSATG